MRKAKLTGYSSHGVWSTLESVRREEAERGNDFPALDYPGETPAIWVCFSRVRALRYLAPAESWDRIDDGQLTEEDEGNKVKVECLDCEYGTLRKAKRILKRSGAKRISEVDSYQELVISVTLPRGITVAAVPLVLDRDAVDILRSLYLKCPPPSREEREDCVILTFVYAGATIYTRFKRGGTPIEELWISNTESRLVPENFRITGLI